MSSCITQRDCCLQDYGSDVIWCGWSALGLFVYLQLPLGLYIGYRLSGNHIGVKLILSRLLSSPNLRVKLSHRWPSSSTRSGLEPHYLLPFLSAIGWAAPSRPIVGDPLGVPTSVAPECMRESENHSGT
jgi:hypothetical protein